MLLDEEMEERRRKEMMIEMEAGQKAKENQL